MFDPVTMISMGGISPLAERFFSAQVLAIAKDLKNRSRSRCTNS